MRATATRQGRQVPESDVVSNEHTDEIVRTVAVASKGSLLMTWQDSSDGAMRRKSVVGPS
jgi:hypothetical protein